MFLINPHVYTSAQSGGGKYISAKVLYIIQNFIRNEQKKNSPHKRKKM